MYTPPLSAASRARVTKTKETLLPAPPQPAFFAAPPPLPDAPLPRLRRRGSAQWAQA